MGTDRVSVSRIALATALVLATVTAVHSATIAAGPGKVADAIRFRQEFGLRADRAFVESTIQNEKLDRATWSVPLTDAELSEMGERARIAASVELMLDYGRSRPGVFGGAYIDQRDGGTINVLVTGDAGAPQWRDAAPNGAAVKVRVVERTERELDELHEQILDQWDSLERQGIDIAYISNDIPGNVVEIGLKGRTNSKVDQLKTRFGPGIRVIEGERIVPAACPESDCANPLRGGIKTRSPSLSSCTSGFHVRAGQSTTSNIKMLSSGHCNAGHPIGSEHTHPGFGSIGPFVESSLYGGTHADAGFIDIPNSQGSRKFWVDPDVGTRDVTAVQNTTQEMIGQTVCKTGISGGWRCGTLTSTNVSLPSGGTLVTKQRRATAHTEPGDSGAPVFFGTKALGIVTGHYGEFGGDLVYSHIKEAKDELGWDHLCGLAGDNC